jgi:hypothetical protein
MHQGKKELLKWLVKVVLIKACTSAGNLGKTRFFGARK